MSMRSRVHLLNWAIRCALTVAQRPGTRRWRLYADDSGEWQHAARQMADGRWTSKMGTEGEDIIHPNPADVGGTLYGEVVRYMKRPVPTIAGTPAD